MDLPIALSTANCRTRVLPRTSATPNGLLERGQGLAVLAGTAPHTLNVQQARQVQHVWSRTGNVAVYDTFIRRGTSMNLICGRTKFIPGPRLYVAPQQLRRVTTVHANHIRDRHPESQTLTRTGSLCAPPGSL